MIARAPRPGQIDFLPAWIPTLFVAQRYGMRGPKATVASLLPVRIMWITYLRRRVPRQALHAAVAMRRDGRRPTEPVVAPGGGRRYRAAVMINAARGEQDQLADVIESIRAYEGADVKIVVGDDATGEYTRDAVRLRFPDVDFVPAAIPAGSAFCVFRTQQRVLLHILSNYEVPMVVKMDPDSLMVGPGLLDRAAERFAADPRVGQLGTTECDASGRPTDFRYSTWLAHPELRWSRRFRRLARRAQRSVAPLRFAQGGCYVLRREMLDTALRTSVLPYRQPWWSMQHDDVLMGLFVQASGYRVGSFGAPGDPIASDFGSLPIEPAEAVDRGVAVVHSVRSSPSGLQEPAIRAYFRAQRLTEGLA